MRVFKYYVDVLTLIEHDGSLVPRVVFWKDKKYKVDKVLSVRETYSRAGGCGICYSCRFGDQIRQLFWERSRWFLESEVYAPEMEDQAGSHAAADRHG